MKRTILIILMAVMIATPCLAQEIEPDGMFSLHGTKWNPLLGIVILPFPWIFPPTSDDFWAYGFYNGEVYPRLTSSNVINSFYVDMIVASFFVSRREYLTGFPVRSLTTDIGIGIMQPMGIGMMTLYSKTEGDLLPFLTMQLLIKTDDNWIPPDIE